MSTPEEIAAQLANLTRESLAGVGVFDTLMRSTKLHLQEEYDAQRITGHEYANVYVSALNAVLQTSAQFLVSIQQELLINAQIDQIRTSIINDTARTANDSTRTANETARTTADIAATEANTINSTNKITKEIELMSSQIVNDTIRTGNDTDRATAEVASLEARTSNDTLKTSAEIVAIENNTVNATKKTNAEVDLMVGQLANDVTKTNNDTARVALESSKVATENDSLLAKTEAEVTLLEQKTATEEANTSDNIHIGLAPGAVAGMTKQQKDLYAAQAKGFKTDAQQKVLKIAADTWAAQIVAGKTILPGSTGFGNAAICELMSKAREGIEITTPIPTTA